MQKERKQGNKASNLQEYRSIDPRDSLDVGAVRKHEDRVRDKASKLYGYRSLESYVAMYHDEVALRLRETGGIRAFLSSVERKKDKALTDEMVDEIVKALDAISRGGVMTGEGMHYTESYDAYVERLTDNVAAWRVKQLCIEDQLQFSLVAPELGADSEEGPTTEAALKKLSDDIDDWLNRSLFSFKWRPLFSEKTTMRIGTVTTYAMCAAALAMVAVPVYKLAPYVWKFATVCAETVWESLLKPAFEWITSLW